MPGAKVQGGGTPQTIRAILEQTTADRPDANAIEAPSRKPLTYKGLMEQEQQVSEFLQSKGLGRDSRVAIVLPNGPEMATAFLCFAGCVTTAPLNPGYRQAEFDFYLADLKAHALVTQAGLDSPAVAVARERRIPIFTLSPIPEAEAGRFTLAGEAIGPPTDGERARPEDIALVLHTSGTTSRPKIVPLTQANLCHSARTIAATLALSEADRCLNVMPLFHIHGLVAAVLSSLTAGGSVVCTPGFYAPDFFPWLEQFSPSWYTAVPTMHQAILERARDQSETIRRHPLRFVRSASSALAPQVMAELEAVFQAPAIEAYGMTEGSHQIASNPLPPATRKPGSVGRAAGPAVAVMDTDGNLLPADTEGEIVIRGNNVTSGYENNPDANASAFTKGWFRTGDQGYLDSEGYLVLTGRIKEIINRGGEKIAPREIEEALLEHPAVAQAVVFAVPHWRLGETVGAAVILREAAPVTPEALRLFLADRLADFKLPERLLFLKEFPKGATGKLQRIGMAARLGVPPIDDSAPTDRPDYAPPRTPEEKRLVEIWAEALGQPHIGIHDPFFQMGGDSMLATRILAWIRDTLQVEIRFVEFFAHPTVAGVADLIEKRRGIAEMSVPPLRPFPHSSALPLSFAQERLWFLDQLDPQSSTYNQIYMLRLQGSLDVAGLNAALTAISERHDSLRTIFTAVNGIPSQVVLPPAPHSLAVIDLRPLAPEAREQEAQRLAVDFAQRPYDLACGPLWRTQLIQLEAEAYLLVIGLHHIVSDGWSRAVLYDEILALYAAFQAGRPSPSKPLPIQYPDFALWQRQWLQGEALATQRAHWVDRLADLPMLHLPTDHPRPEVPNYRGDRCSLLLNPEQTQRLKELARKEGATLYMTVLAAFSALLCRYSGQEDIVVGSPIANRHRSEVEGLIGFFANTLVMRTDVSGDPSFRTLLERVRHRTVEDYTYQDLPFEALVEALQPERSRDRNPLFQVMLVQHNPPLSGADGGGVGFREEEAFSGATPFDLSLIFRETAAGLEFQWEYCTALFESATIERMQKQFETLLEAALADPDCRISRLPLLTESERRQLLVEWSATSTEYPQHRCLHELFAEQAERTPDAVALVFLDQRITYRELNTRANRLAHALQKAGVGPEAMVGLCLGRSIEMVVGLLGILKAGGAYVPLDPSYPPDRLKFMLQDCRAPILLTTERMLPTLPQEGCRILCLDRDWERITQESETAPNTEVCAENPAYVIYTSGSTGQPKGVVICHAGLTNYLSWCSQAYEVAAGSGSPVQSSLSFDLTVTSLWPVLLVGRTVWLVPESDGVEGLTQALRGARDLSLVKITPAHLDLLRHELNPDEVVGRTRTFIVGGEALLWEQVSFWRKRAPHTRIINEYGPTETVVGCCVYECGPDSPASWPQGGVPIGRPIANTQLYVLDTRMSPTPVGVPGELYIGGDGLARGYLGRPDLTAERFVPDPFSEHAGLRLYRTGDRVRYLSDGNLEFLGRIDHQVKIRGFRIELGEIENALRSHPGVREAVVLAREEAAGQKRLVAYVVGNAGPLQVSPLREHLRQRLPEYMLPSAFVVLQSLPLTPNGKVDRKRLPATEASERQESYVAPRTPIEVGLVAIWEAVLGVAEVGLYDNFFYLGGHSLLAARVISRIRDVFEVELPLRTLFDAPTIAQLTQRLSRKALVSPSPLVTAEQTMDIPLSFAQEGLWIIDQFAPNHALYTIPVLLRLQGPLDVRALQAGMEALIARHEPLRSCFAVREDHPVQVIHPPAPLPLPLNDLTLWPVTQQESVLQQEVTTEIERPFDLGAGPLFRSTLWRLSDSEHVLLMTLHHTVADGWSLEVLSRELKALYMAARNGQTSPLPPLSVAYTDYALWQRQWLQGETLETHLAYWREQLAYLPTLELPTDHPRPAVLSYRGAVCTRLLPPSLVEELKDLSRREGMTLFMSLLAGFNILLACCSGQEDVVVGSPVAGRVRAELEPLIGLFINLLVLRTDLSGDPTVRDLLRRVRGVALEAYAHQDVPFSKLVEMLHPQRDPSRNPLFQVALNFQDASDTAWELTGLAVRQESIYATTSKFDLKLNVTENEQGLICEWEYCTDLLEAGTVERMHDRFATLLATMAANPEARLSDLSRVGSSGSAILPNPTAPLAEPIHVAVPQRFLQQAADTPDRTAVEHPAGTHRYDELAGHALCIAQALHDRGAVPGSVVAVSGHRSYGFIVGLLATLMSGAVLLTLDADGPQERRRTILDISGCALILEIIDPECAPTDPPLQSEQAVIRIDAHTGARVGIDPERVGTAFELPVLPPEAPAYLFFTSGSTGVPKGVLGCHKGLSHFLDWQRTEFAVGPQDRCAHLTALSFDVVLRDILLPLTSGATLCIPPPDSELDGSRILPWMDRAAITRLHVVPALASHWLASGPTEATLQTLRTLFFAGEPLTAALVTRWRETFPQAGEIVNLYGPTETTLAKCCYRLPERISPGVQSIGWPLPQTQALVLTEDNRLCPVGVSGEIVIRTPFRSLGYINAAPSDVGRFTANPFREEATDIVYRTGDRGRYREDGALEILGRLDQQVKIRGVRVEPEEVNAVLSQHPDVRQSVVVAREDAAGAPALVAYFVPRDKTTPTEVLSDYLRQRLLAAMVPAVFVMMDHLPLLPNGKVDRRALPPPQWDRVQVGGCYTAPRTPLEAQLVEIWEEMLGVKRIGIHDNFFELGGHSLRATQVISRVRSTFQIELPLRALFEYPCIHAFAQRLSQALSRTAGGSVPPLLRASWEGDIPLSFAQQRLWFLQQLEPDSRVYHLPLSLRLKGDLNATALAASLAEIVRRHEALRTVFVSEEGVASQRVLPPDFTLARHDLSSLPASEREEALASLRESAAFSAFDLEQGPLFRARLVKVGEQEHVLLVGMHHIVSDGWSMGVLTRELRALYSAYCAGEASPLEPLALQYADYAVWQRAWLKDEALHEEISYWKSVLEGAPSLLELPTDRPRPAIQSYKGARLPVVLPEALTRELKELCQASNATLFMTLLGAWSVLLCRYSGQEDLVVGTPIAGRTRSVLEGLIGCFVNTLALRVRMGGDPSFSELLDRVREGCLGGYAHQELPFEKLVEELQPQRSLSHSPIFQTMFTLHNTQHGGLNLPDLQIEAMAGESRTTKFDLHLALSESGGELRGTLDYSTDLFDADRIERMLGQFRTLLEGVVQDPERRLSQQPWLSHQDLHLLDAFNQTTRPYALEGGIHHLIEEQSRKTPHAPALVFEHTTLSYDQLNRRANRLAHLLIREGVRPEVLVGLHCERSLEMVVGILAILKAGGAYVPLDPFLPWERLLNMLTDAGMPLLLSRQALLDRLPSASPIPVLCLEHVEAEAAGLPEHDPEVAITGAHLAYMIYTSGSTGAPKGALNTHAGIINRLLWMQERYGLDASDRILQKTPYSFDVSVWEFLWPLLSGACLVVARPEGHKDPAYLVEVIQQERITTLHFVPSMLQAFVEAEGVTGCKSLRRVICSGEALSCELVGRFYEELAGVELHNLYGPTEAAVDVSHWSCPRGELDRVLIGAPVANTQLHVVDGGLRRVGVGVWGELCIGGVQVGRGYLKRPELTAEKFVPDPFSDAAGARMYRTGDVCRWLSSGALEYLGRLDHQVKIRGFRIELGEIESALLSHPSVREAVVLAREDEPGERSLIAYLVPSSPHPPSPASGQPASGQEEGTGLLSPLAGQGLGVRELREHLAARLPDYMIPSAFVVLEALPLSPNGKIDRKGLPRPDLDRVLPAHPFRPFQAPATPTEQALAHIFSQVLRRERVGVHDNFFELGGHSLRATQVISRIRSAFHIELPLRALFEHPSVRLLSQEVTRSLSQAAQGSVPLLLRASREGALPLSFAQQRLWFLQQLQPDSRIYHLPLSLQLMGALNVDALEASLAEIVRRHEALRTVFTTVEGVASQAILPPDFTLVRHDLSSLPSSERKEALASLWQEAAFAPFDMERGPLFRAELLKLGEDKHLLVVGMHHIVSDGWSMAVLTRELSALYRAFSSNEPSPLEELPLQYADYALWQRDWLKDEVLEAELRYWKGVLAGAPALLELPTDRPRPAVQSHRGARLNWEISQELTEELHSLTRESGTTLFMTLLGAWSVLLSRYSGQEDLVVGTPIAGRTRSELESLIGLFVNTLALRIDASGNPTFRELLTRVREVCLGAYAHQQLPFEKLVEDLQPTRSLSHAPLFQVMLVLQNTQGLNLELPGLHAEEQAEESATAKIDLLLALSEVDGKLVGTLEYSTDLFDRDRIERMLGHFRTLLEGIIASPDARLNAFPLLPQPERHQLLVEWSATHADTPRDRCVHQLFEEQVERSPQAIALVFGDQRLTYRELNARANQLARILHQQGVRPGDRVGLHVQRSVEMIVGLLAILKVGAAYLPLDPASPPERLRTILNEASPALVLCDERGGERVRQLPYPHRLLPSVSAVASAEDPGNFSSGATPQHLAYLMFTSGSTGQPKGIAVPHRAIVRLVCHPNYCHIGPEDTFLQFAPLAFDASTFEIWGCLLHGAQLVLFEGQAPDLQRLGAAIQAHQVSILWLTAGLFHTMIDTYPQGLRGVRQLLAGGDVVSPAHVRRALEELPGCRIVNGYGPTENTTFTCCHTVTSGSEIGASVPIGHPITDTRVYVLDSRMQPVPMGVAGELYTGGEGLAWGYVAHPEWTAERFVPDPFSEEAGARLYRTGDLVRWRSDGELEYLGRLDHQVKVRGFRIELGEIESALRSHPSVREAVVLAREDDPGERRLVAYMVSEQPGDLESAQLQRFLQCSLPDYMLPAAFVTLDALPLTSNGKVDRKALPAPGMKRPEELRGYVAPRTELETTLAGIWCEVLRLERVSVLDSFFDLGGHSLLAVRLFAQIERQLGARLPLSMLFEAPTIARFAARLGDGPTEACWRSLVAIQPCGERPPFFCVHGIGANLLNYRLLAGHLGVDQPFYGFQAQGLDGQQPAHTSLEAMAAHYIAELRTVQPTGPYRLGGGSAGGVVAFEMARQLQAQGENVALLVLIDTYLPIKADCTRNRSRLERLLRGADAHLGHLLLEDRTAVKSYIRHWGAEKLRSLRRGHRNGAHPAVDPELPLAMQQVIVANRAALSAYVPQPYQGRITQMLARKASDRTGEDGRLAWSALASEGLEVHYIAGDHDTMLEEPCVADLAAKLDSCLQRATLSNL